jgi:hypothetical protein
MGTYVKNSSSSWRANRTVRTLAVALAIGLSAAALGCGEDTVDAEKVEEGIEQDLSSSTAQIASVSCPSDVEQEEGKQFTCDAKLADGGKAQVTVTQTDGRGNAIYAFKPGTMQLADNAVEPVIEDSLTARGIVGVQVDCPSLIPVADGKSATCDATGAGGRTGELTYTWSSDDGSIDSSSVQAPGE